MHFIHIDFNILPFQIRFHFYVKAGTQGQHIQTYVFYTSLTKTCKHLGSHNAMKHKQLLNLSSWRAWGWPYKVETCRSYKIYYFCM